MPSRSRPAPFLARCYDGRGWRTGVPGLYIPFVEDAAVLTGEVLVGDEVRVEREAALVLVDRRRRDLLGALVRLAAVEARLMREAPAAPRSEEPPALAPSPVGLTIDAAPIPLSALELSVRARRCLSRAGITTLGQLAVLTPRDLSGLQHLGQRTLTEIRDLLRSLNLSLARELPEPENVE